MTLCIDRENRKIVLLTNTKDSKRLDDLNILERIISVYGYRMGRNDIRFNYEVFDIPEENQRILTATEYIEEQNITF